MEGKTLHMSARSKGFLRPIGGPCRDLDLTLAQQIGAADGEVRIPVGYRVWHKGGPSKVDLALARLSHAHNQRFGRGAFCCGSLHTHIGLLQHRGFEPLHEVAKENAVVGHAVDNRHAAAEERGLHEVFYVVAVVIFAPQL